MILMVGVTRKNSPVIIDEVDRVESPPVCTNLLQLLKLPLYTPCIDVCTARSSSLCSSSTLYSLIVHIYIVNVVRYRLSELVFNSCIML